MNALIQSYEFAAPDTFKIIGVPCNQFNLQEPGANHQEIMNGIKYVRPGGGLVPSFNLTQKLEVNGESENGFYTFVKHRCPHVSSKMGDPKRLHWTPLKTTDVRWNFEKFLVDKQGRVRYRIAAVVMPDSVDVDALISELVLE